MATVKTNATKATRAAMDATDGTVVFSAGEYDLRVYGRELGKTDYADGFNVGTVVTYDVGWSMCLPKYALIVRRTPKMIETVALPTVKLTTDGYGFQGHEIPVRSVYLGEGSMVTRKSRMNKRGTFDVDGRYTKVWDGLARWYDHMD